MKFTKRIAIAIITASTCAGTLDAQGLQNVQTPAEYPPESYRGAQYVDSKGCIYVRAGIDGNVTWVPRVNRQRQVICGQDPSLSAQDAQTALTTPRTASANGVEQITVPQTAATAAPVAAAPVAAAAPRPVAAAPAPQRTVTPRTVAPPAAPAPEVVQASDVVTPTPVPSQQIVIPDPNNVGAHTRVVPRHVHDAREEEGVFPTPKGYRHVWSDDRLNTRRAEQSLEGIARTRFIWTQTVPRRLVERETGEDVTTTVPLVYPYTDTATQTRDLGTVTLVHRNGQLQKRIVRNKARARVPAAEAKSTAPTPVVKQATTRAAPKAAATGRYVQVGTYGQPSNAQAAAQRIIRAGLPARMGKLTRGGKTYQVVLAGPFSTSSALNTGLRTSRAVGFNDAFVR